jgi:hypothetical protein
MSEAQLDARGHVVAGEKLDGLWDPDVPASSVANAAGL